MKMGCFGSKPVSHLKVAKRRHTTPMDEEIKFAQEHAESISTKTRLLQYNDQGQPMYSCWNCKFAQEFSVRINMEIKGLQPWAPCIHCKKLNYIGRQSNLLPLGSYMSSI